MYIQFGSDRSIFHKLETFSMVNRVAKKRCVEHANFSIFKQYFSIFTLCLPSRKGKKSCKEHTLGWQKFRAKLDSNQLNSIINS